MLSRNLFRSPDAAVRSARHLKLEPLERRILLSVSSPHEVNGAASWPPTGSDSQPTTNTEILRSITPTSVLTQDDAGAANEVSDRFGWSLATGDFNQDSFDDLAVGVPLEDTDGATDTGMVVVFYGSPGGLSAAGAERITQNSVVTATNEDGDRFGWSLAAGDFDDDGFDDLAVGIPYEDTDGATDTGLVAVLFGSAAGLLPSNSEAFTQNSVVTATNEDGDLFGWTLAAADFDNDGHDDLAIGVPYEDTDGATDTGLVAIMFGTDNGLLPAVSEAFTQNSVVTASNEDGDRFGYSLAAGNFDGDAFADLAIGVPFEDTGGAEDTGLVAVMFGSSAGLLPSRSEAFTQASLVTATNEDGDRFGSSLAAANFNGDAFDDLAVGIPYENTGGATDTGLIGVFLGSGSGLLPSNSEAFTQNSAHGTNEDLDRAGFAMTAGDFDGDAFDDLIVGVPYEDSADLTDNGAVMAFYGSSAGLLPPRSYELTQSYFGGAEENADRFGYVLANGDFDDNGSTDLAAGTPFEHVGSTSDAGAVFVGGLEPALPTLTAASAIVIDRNSREVLGALLPDERRAQASTTKIMTGLLAVEAIGAGDLSFADTFTIPNNLFDDLTDDNGSLGSTMGLAEGDTIGIRDLLYGLMLPSGNDAAVAVATAVAGSESAFVQQMNTRAAQLGLGDTSFVNPHGRDPEDLVDGCSGDMFENPACAHFSTARDLATVAAFALDEADFETIVGTVRHRTQTWLDANGSSKNAWLCNSNRLLRTPADNCGTSVTYPGAYGVKTGTTGRAGSVLVSAARDSCEDLIAVVMDSDSNGSAGGDRYTDSTTILDFGFSRRQTHDLFGANLATPTPDLSPGSRFDVRFRVANGCSDATAAFNVDFYLSADNAFQPLFDQRLETFRVAGLAGDTDLEFSTQVTLPGPTSGVWNQGSGTYYLFMQTDPRQEVAETNERNNAATRLGRDFITLNVSLGFTADFDGDGDVDGEDFLTWQANFGTQTGASRKTGDTDGDGDVDGADFLDWQVQFSGPGGEGRGQVSPQENREFVGREIVFDQFDRWSGRGRTQSPTDRVGRANRTRLSSLQPSMFDSLFAQDRTLRLEGAIDSVFARGARVER